jgi:hypothetical protein
MSIAPHNAFGSLFLISIPSAVYKMRCKCNIWSMCNEEIRFRLSSRGLGALIYITGWKFNKKVLCTDMQAFSFC